MSRSRVRSAEKVAAIRVQHALQLPIIVTTGRVLAIALAIHDKTRGSLSPPTPQPPYRMRFPERRTYPKRRVITRAFRESEPRAAADPPARIRSRIGLFFPRSFISFYSRARPAPIAANPSREREIEAVSPD